MSSSRNKNAKLGVLPHAFLASPPDKRWPGVAWVTGQVREWLTPAPLPLPSQPALPSRAIWEKIHILPSSSKRVEELGSRNGQKWCWQKFLEVKGQSLCFLQAPSPEPLIPLVTRIQAVWKWVVLKAKRKEPEPWEPWQGMEGGTSRALSSGPRQDVTLALQEWTELSPERELITWKQPTPEPSLLEGA